MKPRKLSPDAEKWFFGKCRESGDRREFLKYLRYKCLVDLPFMAQAVLGYPDCTDTWHYYMAHRFETRQNRHLLVVGGRQTYKSCFANCAQAIQRYLRDPDTTFLMVGGDEGVALGHSDEFAAKIEDERFQAIWGDCRTKPWSPSEGKLNLRGRKYKTKDPSIGVGSPDKEQTSKHPKVIIVDDLEGEVNSRSELRREAAMKYFTNLWGLMHHKGEVWVINTPWHHDFLIFGFLLNPKKHVHKFFDIVVVPIGEPGEQSIVMPGVFTPAKIDEYETIWGWSSAMCQLYLWPVGDKANTFDMGLMDDNVLSELPKRTTRWCIVDPSKSKKHSHDPMGMVALAKDCDKHLILLDCEEVHDTPWQCCKRIYEFADKWKCRGISCELASGVTDYKEMLQDYMDERDGPLKHKFQVSTVTTGNREKNADRIDPLMSLWEQGKLQVNGGMPREHFVTLTRQMRVYPVGRDDILDCVGYHGDVRMFRAPSASEPEKTEEEAKLEEWRDKEKKFAEEQLGSRKNRRHLEIVGGLPTWMMP